MINKIKSLVRSPVAGVVMCIALLVFPTYYLLIILYHPEFSLLHNTEFNYAVIPITGLLFALFAKRIFETSDTRIRNIFSTAFTAMLFLYGVALVCVTYYCYTHYIFESIDVSYYHLALWQLAQWKVPYIWDMPTTPLWLQHFEPILFFIVPIYWFIHDAGVLVIIQALAVVSGAIPLYLGAQRMLKSRFIALASAYAYLAFGGLQVGFAYGFHPIMFFPPLFLWMYYWYVRKKPILYIVFVLLTLFVKEEVSFIMIFWGLYLLWIKKDVRLGLITGIMGFLWYLLCFHVIFPHFSPKDGFVYWSQYNQTYGNGLGGILTFVVKQPRQFLLTLVTPAGKLDMLFCVFGAFAFLPFFYLPSFIIVIPSLMEKVLNSGLAALNGTHYTAAITGVTVVASLETLYVIRKKSWAKTSAGAAYLGALITYIALFSNVLYGCLTFAIFPLGNIVPPPKDNLDLLTKIIASIPESATVGAQYIIAPHIPKPFGKISPWPNVPTGPDFILYDTKLAPILTGSETIDTSLRTLSENKEYRLVVNHLGIVLFEKVK